METGSASSTSQLQNQKGEITCCTTWSAVQKAIESSSLWRSLEEQFAPKNEQSAENASGVESSYKAPVPNGKVSAALINLRSRLSTAEEAQSPQTKSLDAKGTDQADREDPTTSVLNKFKVYLSPQKDSDVKDAADVAPEESTPSQGRASAALTKMRMYLSPGGESKVPTQDQLECHVNGSGQASQSQVAQAGATSSVFASVRTLMTPRKEQAATAKESEEASELDENTSVNGNGESVSTGGRASALLKMRMAQDSVMDKMRMYLSKKDEQESTAGADTDSNTAATNETSTTLETPTGAADDRKAAIKSTAIGAGGGAVVVGAGGGAVGAAAGVPLALVTFGLSVPVGAAIGTAVGGTAGAVGGGAAGYAANRIRSRSRSADRKVGELPG
jgi:hypothetical protein